jgi:hypothetical protein
LYDGHQRTGHHQRKDWLEQIPAAILMPSNVAIPLHSALETGKTAANLFGQL